MRGLNKTTIEWCDFTSNPIRGCKYGCAYCYAREIANRFWEGDFEPTFFPERLEAYKNLPEPNGAEWRKPWIAEAFPDKWLIFLCSAGEMYGDWVPIEWRNQIYKAMWENRHCIFLVLTKSPYVDCPITPSNMWLGATIENQKNTYRQLTILKSSAKTKFLSFEPLHSAITTNLKGMDWIIIGAETGHRKGRIEPEQEWIEHLTQQADNHNIPVFHKDNLAPYYEGELRREFPKS